MASIRIADFEPQLADELVRLWRASFEHGVGIRDHHPLAEQMAYFVEQVVPNNAVRVALDEHGLAGFIASTPESVAHLYVRVASIGQGIGGRLLRLAMAESCGSLRLYTFARNLRARGFYEHHGFVETGRESENMWKLEAIRFRWQRGAGEAG